MIDNKVTGNILTTGKKILVKEKEIIFTQNDTGEEMFLLLKGKVGVYINSFDEFPLLVAEIKAGSIVGEMSVFDGSQRSATVVAEEDTVLLSIKKEDLPQFITERPDLAMNLLRILSKRIRTLNDKIVSLENRRVPPSVQETHDNRMEGWPTAQKDYGLVEPPEYKKYARKRFILCPVCKAEFLSEVPHFTLIRTKTVTNEFRKICVDFDPIWYDIVVCPHCYYTNFYTLFGGLREEDIDRLESSGYCQKVRPFKGYSEIRTINEVLDALYLSVFCNKLMGNTLTQGKLWLRLYWLYTDLKETELIHATAEKAIAAFSLICGERGYDLEPADARRVMAIMASLHQVLGNQERALRCYKSVIQLSEDQKDSVYNHAMDTLPTLGFSRNDIDKWMIGLEKWRKGVRV